MSRFFSQNFFQLIFFISYSLLVLNRYVQAQNIISDANEYSITYKAYRSFKSNLDELETIYKSSNYWDTNIIISNEKLVDVIDRNSQIFFKQDRAFQAEYLFLSANYYFTRQYLAYESFNTQNENVKIQQANQNAYERYLSIIELDLASLEDFKKSTIQSQSSREAAVVKTNQDKSKPRQIYTNYKSSINSEHLNKAFNMHLYAYQSGYFSLEQFTKAYASYKTFFQSGLDYGETWHSNMIVYAYGIKDWQFLIEVADKSLINKLEAYFIKSLYHYAKFQVATNQVQKYFSIKQYIGALQNENALHYDVASQYFNLAETVSTLKVQTNTFSTNSFFSLETNESLLRRGIEYYSLSKLQRQLDRKTLFNKAMLYIRLQEYMKARYFLEKALEIHSDFNTLYALALVTMRLQNYDMAYLYLLEASYHQDSAELYNNLALCILYRQDLVLLTRSNKKQIIKQALDYIHKAIELSPYYYALYKTKAIIHQEDNNRTIYQASLRKALELLRATKKEDYKLLHKHLYFSNVKSIEDFIQQESQNIEKILSL